jgi:hypothetical protein
MLPHVKLIGMTGFKIADFLSDLQTALGRSVSNPIDMAKADPNSPTSLVVAICEMLSEGGNYHKVLKNPGSAIKHLQFNFLALSSFDHCSEISQHTDLVCHCVLARRSIYLHLISGSLEQWRTAIINCSSEIVDYDCRKLFNLFLGEFESLGFKDLWTGFTKRSLTDDTIKLIG